MTDAPENIFATVSMARQLGFDHHNVLGEVATPYVRAEIHEAVVAERDALKAQVDALTGHIREDSE